MRSQQNLCILNFKIVVRVPSVWKTLRSEAVECAALRLCLNVNVFVVSHITSYGHRNVLKRICYNVPVAVRMVGVARTRVLVQTQSCQRQIIHIDSPIYSCLISVLKLCRSVDNICCYGWRWWRWANAI